jgi:opacity protein-like surface antigen
MKLRLVTAITILALTVPMVCSAAALKSGPYFSGFLGTSFARDTTISGFDFFNGASFSDQVSLDPGIYTGGTAGYDFGFIRVEGELSYRHSGIDTITESNGSRFRNVDGNLGVFATMVNVFFDVKNDSRVTPYFGGGIGAATLYLSKTTGFNSSGTYGIIYDESNDTVFAAQVGGGMDIALNNRFSLDLGYRYFVTDKAKLEGDFVTSNFRYESHNGLVGFKFKF